MQASQPAEARCFCAVFQEKAFLTGSGAGAIVRGYEPVQLVGGISQGDRQVTICNREIARAQWPAPPRANDRCVIDGRTTTIQACDTRKLHDDIVLHLIQVRG